MGLGHGYNLSRDHEFLLLGPDPKMSQSHHSCGRGGASPTATMACLFKRTVQLPCTWKLVTCTRSQPRAKPIVPMKPPSKGLRNTQRSGILLLWVPSAYLEMISKFEVARCIRPYFSSGLNLQSLGNCVQDLITAELLVFSASTAGS